MTFYEKIKDQVENKNKREIEVSSEEFQELISDPVTMIGIPKPQPPIKSERIELKEFGILSRKKKHSVSFIEYDYHAPEYLDALARWEAESRHIRNGIYYMGKKVVLKDLSNLTI